MTTSSTLPILAMSPYLGYAYAYPHKTAYRPLCPSVPLSSVWQTEPRDNLFCYVHIPFCEMRCGFCNLLTAARPPAEMVEAYLDSLQRQADAAVSAVAGASFARFAVGGGTPTYLSSTQLRRLFGLLRGIGIDPWHVAGSVETSPATATRERLAVLREAGVARISIGVQTFSARESSQLGRRQTTRLVEAALDSIAAAGFPCVNIDLMYGGEDQTLLSWTRTVERAIDANPDEVYLYPLYVRPLTGLWKQRHQWDDQRMTAYRAARDLLCESGFEQLSMRMFRRSPAGDQAEPEYCCQRNGMIGLGCGARSYTHALHYSTEYAVGRADVVGLVDAYIATSDAEFARVSYGIRLNREEQVRRFVIKSLLRAPGIDRRLYQKTFEIDVLEDLPQLGELVDAGWAEARDHRVVLTTAGLERSDAIGPWLYSQAVKELSERHQWR